MPRLKHLRGSWLHRTFGDRLLAPELWSWNRYAIARGFAIGAFICVIPLPMQSPVAAVLAIFSKSNVPIAMAACWLSNPFTAPVLIYLQLATGCFLLGRPSPFAGLSHHKIWEAARDIPLPWATGVIAVGLMLAAVCYVLGLAGYDFLHWIIHSGRRANPRAHAVSDEAGD